MKHRDESDGHRKFALPGASLHYGPDKTVIVEHIDLYLEPHLEEHSLDGVCRTTVRALDEPVIPNTTIRPKPRSRIAGSTARAARIALRTLPSNISR